MDHMYGCYLNLHCDSETVSLRKKNKSTKSGKEKWYQIQYWILYKSRFQVSGGNPESEGNKAFVS